MGARRTPRRATGSRRSRRRPMMPRSARSFTRTWEKTSPLIPSPMLPSSLPYLPLAKRPLRRRQRSRMMLRRRTVATTSLRHEAAMRRRPGAAKMRCHDAATRRWTRGTARSTPRGPPRGPPQGGLAEVPASRVDIGGSAWAARRRPQRTRRPTQGCDRDSSFGRSTTPVIPSEECKCTTAVRRRRRRDYQPSTATTSQKSSAAAAKSWRWSGHDAA
mmetsp:Transcript_7/g.31  ORF Transcript_7/g.31 Transcript_7/m.31 type:complete len:217 (+) Transcript_7:3713-4363(+)